MGVVGLSGCTGREPVPSPAASPRTNVTVTVPPVPAERVISYPEGRWELHGDGTASWPYFWVWIPAGATPPDPPPAPQSPSR